MIISKPHCNLIQEFEIKLPVFQNKHIFQQLLGEIDSIKLRRKLGIRQLSLNPVHAIESVFMKVATEDSEVEKVLY